MSNTTAKQQTLVKARKAARVAAWLLIFGGVVLFLYGIFTAYLPVVLDGIVLCVTALLPFVVSKYAEKKLNGLDV